MKIVRFRLKPETETFYGVLDGLSIKRLSAEPYDGLHFTGDEYAYAAAYYDAQNAAEHQAHFQWKDVSDIVNVSDEEAVQMLTEGNHYIPLVIA